jgi:MAP3K TRAFs-binding domain
MLTSENQPLCFVLMPFGSKPDPGGGPDIDFDRTYRQAIKPGIEDADMFPVRADEEKLGGIIHKAMFERLLICEFAVADLTTSNPNVMYELGIRHAARPRTTLTIYAASTPLPFDVNLLRTQPYRLEADNELSESSAAELRRAVTGHLRDLRARAAREAFTDSPLFQLITRWKPHPLPLEAAEFSYDKVKQNERLKGQLRLIRKASADVEQRPSLLDRLASIRVQALAAGDTVDAGVLTELMDSYRALEAWSEMITVYEAMPNSLQQQVPIRQQLAFAYNRRAETEQRADDRAQALDLLENLEQQQGVSPETSGMIGRIYKGRWREASEAQDAVKARQFLVKAVDAYRRGFEADWREVYPGVNAVTLLEVQGDTDALALKERLLPVVRFAAEQRLQGTRLSYWDHATLLELAVLVGDIEGANDEMDDVLSTYSETWQPQTTAGNLRIIHNARRQRDVNVDWIEGLIEKLVAAAGWPPTTGLASGPS